jgi:hypothetical protein
MTAKKKIVKISVLVAIVIVFIFGLVYMSDQSELSCKLIGGKYTLFKPGCMDCVFGCNSPLRQFYDWVRRGFRPEYLG